MTSSRGSSHPSSTAGGRNQFLFLYKLCWWLNSLLELSSFLHPRGKGGGGRHKIDRYKVSKLDHTFISDRAQCGSLVAHESPECPVCRSCYKLSTPLDSYPCSTQTIDTSPESCHVIFLVLQGLWQLRIQQWLPGPRSPPGCSSPWRRGKWVQQTSRGWPAQLQTTRWPPLQRAGQLRPGLQSRDRGELTMRHLCMRIESCHGCRMKTTRTPGCAQSWCAPWRGWSTSPRSPG